MIVYHYILSASIFHEPCCFSICRAIVTHTDQWTIVELFFLLTLIRFQTLFRRFHYWLWTSKCWLRYLSANIYLFKVDSRNNSKRCEVCSKLFIETPDRQYWCHSGVFSAFIIVFLFFTLSMYLLARFFSTKLWNLCLFFNVSKFISQYRLQKNRCLSTCKCNIQCTRVAQYVMKMFRYLADIKQYTYFFYKKPVYKKLEAGAP